MRSTRSWKAAPARAGVSFVAAFGLVVAGVAPASTSDEPVDQAPATPSVEEVAVGDVWDMPSQIPAACVPTALDASPDATLDASPSESPSDSPATPVEESPTPAPDTPDVTQSGSPDASPEPSTPSVESTEDAQIASRTGSLPESPTAPAESPAPAEETSAKNPGPSPSLSDSADAQPPAEPSESSEPSVDPSTEPSESVSASPSASASPTASASPSATPEAVVCPQPVTGVAAEGGPNSASVSWTINDDGAAPEGFYVEVTGPEGFAKTVTVPAPASGNEVAGLKNGIEYSFRVTAATRDGSAPSSAWVTATPSTGMEGVVAGVIVEFEPGSEKAKGEQNVPGEDRVEGVDLTVGDKVADDAVLVEISEPVDVDTATRIADDLEADPEVSWAEPDQFFFTSNEADASVHGPGLAQPVTLPADSDYASSQWNLWDTYGVSVGDGNQAMTDAWAGATGDGVNVAVIDTGITAHPDLDSQLVAGYDFVSNPEKLAAVRQANAPPVAFDGDYIDEATYGALGRDNNPADPGDWRGVTPTRDSSWHGTQMAGIIAAANNADGITGVAPNAKVQPIRALSWRGGLLSDIAAGITWASGGTIDGVPANENPSTVINMSFAVETICPVALQDAIDGARDRGAILVAAAGNASDDAAKFAPGNCNGVITVAASNRDGQRADYSNYGPAVDISAPGGDSSSPIATTSNTGTQGPDQAGTGSDFGTSAAAAHVSAAAAILTSRNASLTPDQAYEQLTGNEFTKAFANETCDAVNPDYTCGTGILSLAQIQTIASGDQDYAMTFSGDDQYGEATDDPVFDLSETLTLEAWLYPTATQGCFIAKRSAYEMCLDNGGYWFGLDSSGTPGWEWYPNSGIKGMVDQWQHFAFTKDGTNAKFYLNGQLAWSASNAPATLGNSSDPFILAIQNEDSLEGEFAGRMDEVRVYNTVRSESEIQADMHTYGPTDTTGLVAYYDFNEGPAGTTGTGTVYNRASGATSATNVRTVNGPSYTNVKQVTSNGNNTVVTFPRSYLTAAGGWRMPEGASGVDYLVVAGGGGGGGEGNRGNWKGGGGAGGQVDSGSLSYSSIPVEVSVGLGGIGGPGDTYGNAGSGGSTTFGTATVTGGGRGGSATSSSAESGGIYTQTTYNPNGAVLGGGGSAQMYRQLGKSATAYSGGNGDGHPSNGALQAGGGGAGAGANGTDGNAGTGGNGGNGVSSSITGTATTYGGGGGGGGGTTAGTGGTGGGGSGGLNSEGEDGSANSGGGGGGAGDAGVKGDGAAGGNGGSGVVIVSYSTVNTSCEPFESSYIDEGTVYRVLKWSDPAQTGCTWTVPTGVSNFDYLIVGGGGAGGSADGATSSGGGGGGRVIEDSVTSPAASYSVTVGSGGEAQSVPSSGLPGAGGDGGTSSLGAFQALGGSGGASAATGPGDRQGPASTSGWTGGGGSVWAGDSAPGSQGVGGGGYKGGDAHADGNNSSPQAAGGGGGAGGAGANASAGVAGDGGVGVESTITGRTESYGGGGGGGKRIADGSAGSGMDGGGDGGLGTAGAAGELGGGGGGAGVNNDAGVTNLGGAGGDGVVIVRYAIVENDTCEPFQYISGDYTVVEFQDAGTCTWTVPTPNSSVDVLVVGGGGGGGGGSQSSATDTATSGGGGGGGQTQFVQGLSVTGSVSITVGAGGSGGVAATSGSFDAGAGTAGGSSAFGSTTALGGEGGGPGTEAGVNTSSGDGGGSSRTVDGASTSTTGGVNDWDGAGGGAGAGEDGSDGSDINDIGGIGGAGGLGYRSSITGASVVYGGGGGGGGTWDGSGSARSDGTGGAGGEGGGGAGAQLPGTAAAAGSDGLGGGGGGGGRTDGTASVAGADGGDGVVIVRYLTDPPYVLNYNANGGSGAPASSTWTYDSTATLSSVTPTRSRYTFTGWNTAANGSGTGYAPGGTFTMPASNVTLYAQWTYTPGTCSIVFNANGGGGSAPTVSAPCFTWVNADSGAGLSKADSTLSGWNTSANGTGSGYGLGAPLYLTGSNTLYAQWRSNASPDPDAGGGDGGPTGEGDQGDGSSEPSEPGEVLAPIAVTSGPDEPVLVDPLMSDPPAGQQWDPASVRLIDPTTGKLRKRLETKQGTWTVNTQTGEVAFLPRDGFVGTAQVEFRVRTDSGQRYRSSMAVTVDPDMAPGLRQLSTSVYFAALSAELDSEAKTKLRNLIRRVNKRGTQVTATVVGYVQPVGGVANDFTLSGERAENTAAYLRRRGVEFIVATEGLGRADEPSAKARRATATIWYSVD